MPVEGYEVVTIKSVVIDRVRQFLKQHPEQGYKSIADFVTDAIRTKLNELEVQIATMQPPVQEVEG